MMTNKSVAENGIEKCRNKCAATIEDVVNYGNTLLLICNQLHARDIIHLEMTSRRLRAAVFERYWPNVEQLVLDPPVFANNECPNPLNLALQQNPEEGEIITSEKIDSLLDRCGRRLRILDLAQWRWTILRSELGRWKTDPVNITDICQSGQLIAAITAKCLPPRLHTLDLSWIPMCGKWLSKLSPILHGLHAIRLAHCFHGSDAVSSAEFSEFLASMPNLVELDLTSNNLGKGNVSFSNISTKLQSLKAIGTLNVEELNDAAKRALDLREIHFGTNNGTNQQSLTEILFATLKNIEVLWLECCAERLRLVINNAVKNCIRSLHIFGNVNQDILLFDEGHGPIECHSKMPNLEELILCDGRNFLSHFIRCCSIGIVTNLTRLYIAMQSKRIMNDKTLEPVARLGKLQELRLVHCKNITWRAFGIFLDYCPNINLFEGCEQMTDELLERVMYEMDRRRYTANDGNQNTNNNKFLRRFYFVRQEKLEYGPDDQLFNMMFLNEQCKQSESQNMHPLVVYSEEPERISMRKGKAEASLHSGIWPYAFGWH